MRALVVEDEEIAAARLIRLSKKILGTRLSSLVYKATLQEANSYLNANTTDLLFLDLNLNGRDGFRLLRMAAAGSFQTIIVSAQHDQALRAFEYGVTDFVAKPYDEHRLRQAIERVSRRERSLSDRLRYLAIKKGSQIIPIQVSAVLFVQGADDYSEIHCDDGTRHLHSKTLNALEHLLPSNFLRVHRSYLLNVEKVESYRSEPGSRYIVRLVTGTELPVSRARYRELKEKMG